MHALHERPTYTALLTRIPGDVKPEGLLQAMSADKKKKAGRQRFVLLRDIGDAFVTDRVDQKTVLETLKELTVEGFNPL